MERREPTQKALVLAGGGARGSYQVGVWRALMELDWHPQIITGTSVGGLNGAMFVLDLYETARDMWLTIRSRDVMELPEENADLSALHQFLRRVVKEGGMDVTPLEEIVERVLDEDALRARQIDGGKFLDGGYSDNMPTGLAKTMGAEELVCVDLEGVGITRPNLTGLPTTMIRSYWELGDILHFDPDTAKRNMELGYYDTRRAMGYLRGCAYAVSCDAQSCEDAAAFAQKFSQLQRAVREKYPVTLTADVALKLANMTKDDQLAPLEAAAEDAGVDPTRFYTTRTLAQAFLAACDKDRMESFAPLFTGSSTAGQAALAALLPNTFLQALVWRTLTAPALPEVTEDEGL